jgi:hypothetical protein
MRRLRPALPAAHVHPSAHTRAQVLAHALVPLFTQVLLAAALLAGMAAAQAAPPLPDPTRPPGAEAAAAGPSPGAPRVAAGAPRTAAAATAAASAPQLQSVHVPRAGQAGEASALVDGRLLRVGDRLSGPFGERVVLAIDTQGLTLGPPGQAGTARTGLRLPLLAAVGLPQPVADTGRAAQGTALARAEASGPAASAPPSSRKSRNRGEAATHWAERSTP